MNFDNPLVTISIPSYNHARWLPITLESALAQTYRPIEIVVVDDGSPDDSLEILQQYAAAHPSMIRVHTHPGHVNKGISATVNLGFRLSRGRYWTGLPSDDVLYPHAIERQVQYLESHPEVGWVYSRGDCIDAEGRALPSPYPVLDINRHPDPLASMLRACWIFSPRVMVRRECMERTGDHDETLVGSDWDFWFRMLVHSKVGFIEEPLMQFRSHSYNTSLNIDKDTETRMTLAVLVALRRKLPGLVVREEAVRLRRVIDRTVDRIMFDPYYQLIQTRQRPSALRVLRRAVRTAPCRALRPRRILSLAKNYIWPHQPTRG